MLVVDARSMARSAAALVYGFKRFDPALNFAGVIFNQIGGEAHLKYLKEAVASACPEVAVLGGIPGEDRVRIPERHLGLVTADEMRLDAGWQKTLAELMEKRLDIDLLLEKTRLSGVRHPENPPCPLPDRSPGQALEKGGILSVKKGGMLSVENRGIPPATGLPGAAEGSADEGAAETGCGASPPVIAVARDAAFCFYYPDNLELLEKAGARLRFFSPVCGETLPEDLSGAYLGGGYPELFAKAISENARFLHSLRERAGLGMPIYAECGGLMTLGRFIDTVEGEKYNMAGILPFGTRMLPRRKALGYTEVVLRRQCLLGGPGRVIRGHEFHYSEIAEPESDSVLDLPSSVLSPPSSVFEFAYDLRGRKHEAARPEGYQAGSVLASYIHLHWGSAPEAAKQFVSHCAEWAKGR